MAKGSSRFVSVGCSLKEFVCPHQENKHTFSKTRRHLIAEKHTYTAFVNALLINAFLFVFKLNSIYIYIYIL